MSSVSHRMVSRLAVTALLLIFPLCSFSEEIPKTGAATPSTTEPVVVKTYSISILDEEELRTAVRFCCHGENPCFGDLLRDGVWILQAPERVQSQFAALLAEQDVPPPTIRLQIHLLREIPGAEAGATQPTLTLPENAMRALKDLEQVMPGRRFELMDSAELRTTSEAMASLARHTLSVAVKKSSGTPKSFFVKKFELFANGEGRALSTNFGIDFGETVVVGIAHTGGQSTVILFSASP